MPTKNKIEKMLHLNYIKELILANRSKKTFLKIAVYLVLAIIALILLIIAFRMSSNRGIYHRHVKYPTDMKYILFWSLSEEIRTSDDHIFRNKTQEFIPGQSTFMEQKCPKLNCFITYDKNILNHDQEFDAVVFDIDDVRRINRSHINLTRDPAQVYIFRSNEPPEKHPICASDFDKFFNWTWTYKLNSDIVQPFYDIYSNNTLVGPKRGMIWHNKMEHNDQYTSNIPQKSFAVAWIINKCKLKSKYKMFTIDLQNHLKVHNLSLDTFGKCGTNKCPNITKCQNMIGKKYYFQLVVEEYASEDYVTDIMVTALASNTVPILVGVGDYRNFLPPTAYINAQTYDNRKLAALINYLIINPEMYEFFFDWKSYYSFKESSKNHICDLCEKLNNKNQKKKSYKHFRYWWEPEFKDICERARLYKIFNK